MQLQDSLALGTQRHQVQPSPAPSALGDSGAREAARGQASCPGARGRRAREGTQPRRRLFPPSCSTPDSCRSLPGRHLPPIPEPLGPFCPVSIWGLCSQAGFLSIPPRGPCLSEPGVSGSSPSALRGASAADPGHRTLCLSPKNVISEQNPSDRSLFSSVLAVSFDVLGDTGASGGS